jgi:hypothetical protein
MKKDIITHLTFLFSFLFLISLIKHWFSFYYFTFWLGGLVGVFLPILDHIFYAYILRPYEQVSIDIRNLIKQRYFKRALSLIYATRRNRSKLVIHTAYFQVVFLALTFFVVTSSGSLFGRGLVLAFSLHLFIDQLSDFMERREIGGWFRDINIVMDNHKTNIYIIANIFALCILGFLL